MNKHKINAKFNYRDGIIDGELGILLEDKFAAKDIVVYFLKEIGYTDAWIAKSFVGFTENYVKSAHLLIKNYCNDIYNIKQRKAMDRLINAVKSR